LAELSAAVDVFRPNGQNVSLRKFGQAVIFAFERDVPATFVAVAVIVGDSAKFKMGRIDTQRGVAAMPDDKPDSGVFAVLGLKSFPVRASHFPSRADRTVASAVHCGRP
jgi:hypothetical protein